MPNWTDDEYLVFDLMFALSKIKTKPRERLGFFH